jgi:hypothetical protein
VGIVTVLKKEKGMEMTATEPFGTFGKKHKDLDLLLAVEFIPEKVFEIQKRRWRLLMES